MEKESGGGLVFSDRNYYFLNKDFKSSEINEINGKDLILYIANVINAFGWSTIDGLYLVLQAASGNHELFE
ncbi:hypothetical protein ACIQY5_21270 [Peribacillus frigoritolerans]|uniref:hypothetical protein n=1 Tax=Peribacillus frigoritolerans TaxID=450367 RepID=UPI003815B595